MRLLKLLVLSILMYANLSVATNVDTDYYGYHQWSGNQQLMFRTSSVSTARIMSAASLYLRPIFLFNAYEETSEIFTVKMRQAPLSTLTIDITSDKPRKLALSDTLVFTPDNWRTEQDIIGTSIGDVNFEDEIITITHITKYQDLSEINYIYIKIIDNDSPDSVGFLGKSYLPVVSPKTNRIWLDRNLGASQVATSLKHNYRYSDRENYDRSSYGDLYQWGRATDGHQNRKSVLLLTKASNIKPKHSGFIVSENDWTDSTDNRFEAWADGGVNDICPVGFEVPTFKELTDEIDINIRPHPRKPQGGFLKLPLPGYRSSFFGDNAVSNIGAFGAYWTRDSNSFLDISHNNNPQFSQNASNANAFSVRCISTAKANVSTVTTINIAEQSFATYTIALNSEPSAEVVITANSDNPAIVAATTLTFSAANWGDSQTVTIRAVDDDNIINEAATITHTVASVGFYNLIKVANFEVKAVDDDTHKVAISTSALSLIEQGFATYTIALETRPSSVVTISINSENPAATVLAEAIFTAGTWNISQTISVTAVDDVNKIDETFNITHEASSADPNYDAILLDSITINITDNDHRIVYISPTTLSINEGEKAEYTVSLATRPTDNVIITPNSTNLAAAISGVITFTPTAWSVSQIHTVTVFAIDDYNATNEIVVINNAVSGGDYGRENITATPVIVSITDNDRRVVNISPTTLNITEGENAEYTVNLATRPSSDVIITPNSPDAVAAVSTAITFTQSGWSKLQGQTITVFANEDDDGTNENLEVSNAVSGSDYGRANITAAPVTINITDDDPLGVTVSRTTISIDEGEIAQYTISLDTKPTADVTISSIIKNTTTATVSAPITIEPTDWQDLKTITITAIDDQDAITESFYLRHTISGGDYSIIKTPPITITVIDDDIYPAITLTARTPIIPVILTDTIHSITPEIGNGLTFINNIISGTPIVPAATTTYTIIAITPDVTRTLNINILVNPAAPDIAYFAPQALSLLVGKNISITPSNSGGEATFEVRPALPDGLTISTSSGEVSGRPDTVQFTKTYTITATNVSGDSTASIPILIKPATIIPPRVTVEGHARTFNIAQNFGIQDDDYTITSSNTQVATISINNDILKIIPISAGDTEVIITASNSISTKFSINVNPPKPATAANIIITNPIISPTEISFTITETSGRTATFTSGIATQTIVITATLSGISEVASPTITPSNFTIATTITAITLTQIAAINPDTSTIITIPITPTPATKFGISITTNIPQSANTPESPTTAYINQTTGVKNQTSNYTFTTPTPHLTSATPIKNRKIKLNYSKVPTATTYNIYYTTEPPANPNIFDHQKAQATTTFYITPKLPIKPHFFIITSEDQLGTESPASNQLQALPIQ